MAVFLSPVGGVAAQFFSNNGVPLSGGKLYTYAAGTTTPAATYTSSSGVTPHANPIVLDSGGRVPGGETWLTDGTSYKFLLKDSTDVLIATYDNIVGINSNFVNFFAQEEIQTATAGQTVFTLANPYVPGGNTLSVFVDGVNQYSGSTYSYVETSASTVTFDSGLHVGALVKFTTVQSLTSGQETDAALVTYNEGGAGAVTTTVRAKLQQIVSVIDFGAVGNGTTDDTAAIQAAVNYAAPLGKIVYVPAGTYKITATITKPMSNYGINMLGEGYYSTRFNYATLGANVPCIRITGGSGYLCGANIEGIGFDGNATNTWAVEIRGQCGQMLRRCQFSANLRGVVYHNYDANSFTEYCTATDCDFASTCVTAVEYKRTSGNDSFNGTGIAGNSTINANGVNPVIIVNDNCLVYNAPLSTQIWNISACTLIQNLNTTILNCNWYGAIRAESFGGVLTLASSAGALTRTFFLGTFQALNDSWARGTMIISSQFTGKNTGEGRTTLQPLTVKQTGVVTGTAITFNPAYGPGGADTQTSQSYLLQIRLQAANYQYTHIAVVSYAAGSGGSDAITTLATQQAFNVTGWGASTFAINASGQLVVTNASVGFNVTAYIGVSVIGAGAWA